MFSNSKLTKSQRRRRNERVRREGARWFEDTIGPIPDRLVSRFEGIPGNIEPFDVNQLTSEERAPRHVVDIGEEPTFNVEVLSGMRSEWAIARQKTRDDYIADLKFLYRKLWGRRGAAKEIIYQEAKRGNSISLRTLQRYFKLSP